MCSKKLIRVRRWQVLSRETTFQKYSREIEKVVLRMPNDEKCEYFIKKEGPAAAVLALTPNLQVILTKQYRPGPNKILLELPGGFVDPDEGPKKTIARELLEETGYQGELRYVATCVDDAYSTMMRYCFVATNCKRVKSTHPKKDEFLQRRLVSLNAFRKLLRSGEMTDTEVGYLGLDYLNLL